jgi:hypothetical protein
MEQTISLISKHIIIYKRQHSNKQRTAIYKLPAISFQCHPILEQQNRIKIACRRAAKSIKSIPLILTSILQYQLRIKLTPEEGIA